MDNFYAKYNNKEEFKNIIDFASTLSAKLPNGHYISKYGIKNLYNENGAYIIIELRRGNYFIDTINDLNDIDLTNFRELRRNNV